jgi:hypothetical protein
MGRPSKLSEKQWAEIEKRILDGEPPAALAKEYGVNRSALTRRLSQHVRNIKQVANQIVETDVALRALPVAQQVAAINLADELKAISGHLASAGKYGAMTAHRLSAIAHSQTDKIDDVDPMSSQDALQGIAGLTKMANSASEIAINLLRANKEAVDNLNSKNDISEMTEAEIRAELAALGE